MKKWLLISGGVLLGLLLIIAGGGYLWIQHVLKKSLPQTSGEIYISGITDTVEIKRDTYGIPHIYAQNEPDLYFALGYAMAQDRFWQMEFHRRLGNGRLSEIFGEEFIEIDRYFRMITASGINHHIPATLPAIHLAFIHGINAYLGTHKNRLPIEFKVLGYTPESWKVEDILGVLKIINWGLSMGWRVDLTAGKILDKVDVDMLKEAFPDWMPDAPLIISEHLKTLSKSLGPTFKIINSMNRLWNFSITAVSNNWVVSGKKSITGKPILANDPHLGLTNPSIWWEVHLICPTMNVSGFSIAGAPGIAIGHNRNVAWGITNVMVDDVDFYIEKINPDNPKQYRYKDRWEDMEVISELIRVKDKDPVNTQILLTRHGPIVTDASTDLKTPVISAKWAYTDHSQPWQAASLLAKAKDINDVTEALRSWVYPGQNFVFADTQDNIGYWCSAAIPIRMKGNGLLPKPGWTDEYEWKGYVPFEQKPHQINPKEGFIASANNKVMGNDDSYGLGNYWEPSDRITRIRQLLNGKEKLSVADFKKMHTDSYCPLASELTPKLIEVLKRKFSSKEAKPLIDRLSKWDFVMSKESVAACLYETTYLKMMENIFTDELGEALFQAYLQTTVFPPRAMRMMTRKGNSQWFDDVSTSKTETLDDIIVKSLKQSVSALKETLGDDMDQWKWGNIHTLTFEHVLGKKRPLHKIFNLGPFPVDGNHLTVNMKQYEYDHPYKAVHGASARMIVNFSNMKGALHVLPTGESGHLKSAHYKDQMPLYLTGEYHPAWIDRMDVEQHTEETLLLKPKKE